MNACIIAGKIISEIEFKFILNSKNKSIILFKMELLNKSIVKIKAYDEIAEYCYRKLSKEKEVLIYGNIKTSGEVEIQEIF